MTNAAQQTEKRHVHKIVSSPAGRLTLVATDRASLESWGKRPPRSRAIEPGRRMTGIRY